MVKADLIEAVYTRLRCSRDDAAEAVEATLTVIKNALQQGEAVQITGFGRFSVRQKSQRVGRNPKTGQAFAIPPRKVLTFTPSQLLRELLNDEEGL